MSASVSTNTTESRRPLAGVNRLFAAGQSANFDAHRRAYGDLNVRLAAPHLADTLERAGLTGRGGAGFAAYRKLNAVSHARAQRLLPSSAVVIANGAEGEPRSIKDDTLLVHAPHLVIDGLLVAGAAVHAHSLYVYAPRHAADSIRRAAGQRGDADNIIVVDAVETFISGEASAVVNAIQNNVALPTDQPVRLSTTGLSRRPTLVHNVETLAHLALIARYGADWFRSVGSARDPGTRLVTISGAVPAERVLEVPGDTQLSEILRTCGAFPQRTAAVLVGGYHGAWIPQEWLDIPLSPAALAPLGAHPGSGVLYVLGDHQCGLAATAQIVAYLAGESARQCGPCMFGLPEMARLITRIASGDPDPRLSAELKTLSQMVAGRGACHHPDGTSKLVLNTLNVFADDVNAHLTGHCIRRHP